MTQVKSKERLWTRDLVLASTTNLFLAFVFYMLMTTMAGYAIARFNASDTLGGLTSSVFVIGATVARLFAGNLVDLVGRRRTLTISLVVFLIASLSYLPADALDSLGVLLVVRAIHGVAFAVASTAAMALAQSLIPPPAAPKAPATSPSASPSPPHSDHSSHYCWSTAPASGHCSSPAASPPHWP